MAARPYAGSPHPRIPLPASLYPDRHNSAGLDLSDEHVLASLERRLAHEARRAYAAQPLLAKGEPTGGTTRPLHSPANVDDIVGQVADATPEDVEAALALAAWQPGAGRGNRRPERDDRRRFGAARAGRQRRRGIRI